MGSQVATNATLAYQAGLWFWMTPQSPKPSCHEAMTGAWQPTASDTAGGRAPGYGMTTNIINGGLECNMATNDKVIDRVEYYKRYADILNAPVDTATLYCDFYLCVQKLYARSTGLQGVARHRRRTGAMR